MTVYLIAFVARYEKGSCGARNMIEEPLRDFAWSELVS